ncbi:hypothetical protein D9758_009345 [Tetrapyrgos nigripes]|uniref:Peroxisomal membrane protein PEX13 n=1 Tax=Tetrapyrgos nigripes TaxID=182062 RepID=A0A8H5GH99_9AGAR|nr:hypothetical protein D9758_009345 [Tetrapyrgos nigripes]
MGSPPKPWERNGAVVAAAAASTPSLSSTTAAPAVSSSTIAPTVPERPMSFPGAGVDASTSSIPTSTALNSTTPYSYGTSPYNRLGAGSGSYGALGGYGSSYGAYGSSYGGMGYGGGLGYGSYGGGYGGYGMNGMGMGMGYGGMGMGGMGMGGMGMGGMYGPPQLDANGNPIPTLTQTFEATTHHTFALLHSIVQTFGGLAQMLESTFMATHSSFFAMVGVVDQFAQLRNALGSVLGLFGLVRWMREALTGTRTGPDGAMQDEFRRFMSGGRPAQGGPPGAARAPNAPRGSKKPLIFFLIAMFGIPYAMTKLIKILAARAQAQGVLPNGQPLLNANGQPLPPGLDLNGQHQLPPLDPSQLTFARALYPFSASNSSELSLKENEIVAIMGKWDNRRGAEVDPRIELEAGAAGEAEWWKGRTRDGKEGWFPKKWVEVLKKKEAIA